MTVKELFSHAGISAFRCVRWGQKMNCPCQGIYIVSNSGDPESPAAAVQPDFNDAEIRKWIDRLPGFTLDGVRPDVESLKNRLARFWFPNESVLYIGQTESDLSKRVNQYYKTELGARKPHSGGQWLKTLRRIDALYVYYAPVENPIAVESELLRYFCDKAGEYPFANLEGPNGRKRHGLKGQRDPKA